MSEEMPVLEEDEINRLVSAAREKVGNGFIPYGGTSTASAVLTEKGSIYTGVNVKSVISGMGTCSERNAMNTAITNGEYKFKALCVARDADTGFKPCGMCLQLMNEFAQLREENDMWIIMAGTEKMEKKRLRELLPDLYGPDHKDIDLSDFR
jgi:cytidine deaminase